MRRPEVGIVPTFVLQQLLNSEKAPFNLNMIEQLTMGITKPVSEFIGPLI